MTGAQWISITAATFVGATLSARPALTQEAREKQLTLVISFNAGGGADAYGRLVARHLGRHLSGTPRVIVKNMPGAGGLLAANYLYNVAPKDGSEIGMFPGNIASLPLIKGPLAKYDVQRFNWIGSPTTETMLCVASPSSGVTTIDDVFKTGMITGTAGTATHDVPAALNAVLATKFKLVSGYAGSAGLRLATERGEIEGFCGIGYDSLRPAILSGQLKVLVQLSERRTPELPDVGSIFQYAASDEQRQILDLTLIWGDMARPMVAPPDVAEARVAELRDAFTAMMNDNAFAADAAKSSLYVQMVSGAEIATMIERVYATPKDVINRAATILQAH